MRIKAKWSKLDILGSVRPSARFAHRCEVVRYTETRTPLANGVSQRSDSDMQEETREVTKLVLFWGSNAQDVLSDCFEYDPETCTWSRIPEADVDCSPDERGLSRFRSPAAAMAVTSHGQFVYIFGGMIMTDQEEALTNALLRYDAQTHTLTVLPVSGTAPCPRVGATITYIPEGTTSDPILFLFGGYTQPYGYLDDSYIFNLHTNEWSQSLLHGEAPSPREQHSAVYWPGRNGEGRKVVFYGGMASDEADVDKVTRLDDVVFLNIDAAEWIHPVVEGDIPPGRSKHTAVVYNNKMVVFGGQEGLSEAMPPLKFSNKLHVFDIENATWDNSAVVLASEDDSLSPESRSEHAAVMIGDRMYVCMGMLGYNMAAKQFALVDDMWCLELGPPLPPGPIKRKNTGDRRQIIVQWEDETSWHRSRTYQLVIARLTDSPLSWVTVYTGKEKEVAINQFETSDGTIHQIDLNGEYILRVLAISWAGDSSEWDASEEVDYALRKDFLVVRPTIPGPPAPPRNVRLQPVDWSLDTTTLKPKDDLNMSLSWEPSGSRASSTYRVEVQCCLSLLQTEVEEERVFKKRKVGTNQNGGSASGLQDGRGVKRSVGEYGPRLNGDSPRGEWTQVWQGSQCTWSERVEEVHKAVARPQYNSQKRGAAGEKTGFKRTREENLSGSSDVIVMATYRYRVIARNTYGESQPSEESNELQFKVHPALWRSPEPQAEYIPLPQNTLSSMDNEDDLIMEAPEDMDVDKEFASMEASPMRPPKDISSAASQREETTVGVDNNKIGENEVSEMMIQEDQPTTQQLRKEEMQEAHGAVAQQQTQENQEDIRREFEELQGEQEAAHQETQDDEDDIRREQELPREQEAQHEAVQQETQSDEDDIRREQEPQGAMQQEAQDEAEHQDTQNYQDNIRREQELQRQQEGQGAAQQGTPQPQQSEETKAGAKESEATQETVTQELEEEEEEVEEEEEEVTAGVIAPQLGLSDASLEASRLSKSPAKSLTRSPAKSLSVRGISKSPAKSLTRSPAKSASVRSISNSPANSLTRSPAKSPSVRGMEEQEAIQVSEEAGPEVPETAEPSRMSPTEPSAEAGPGEGSQTPERDIEATAEHTKSPSRSPSKRPVNKRTDSVEGESSAIATASEPTPKKPGKSSRRKSVSHSAQSQSSKAAGGKGRKRKSSIKKSRSSLLITEEQEGTEPGLVTAPEKDSKAQSEEIDVEGGSNGEDSATQLVRDETGRPELGNPANGFHFNLRFGDRIEVFSDQEGPPLWYKARVLWYNPLKEDNWKIKVHYEGYNKKFDQHFVLIKDDKAGIDQVREPTDDEEVISGDQLAADQEEELFRLDAGKKNPYLNNKEKDMALRGEIMIRYAGGIRKSMG